MRVNIWIALRQTAHDAVKTRLNWNELEQGPYTGPVPNWVHKLFSRMADRGQVQKLFRADRRWLSAGAVWRNWTLYSVNLDESTGNLVTVREMLQDLVLQYPNMVEIVGAWHWDGRPIGVNKDGVGTPTYPLSSRILEFIPDEEDGSRPTAPKDINLVFGQSPRQF